MHAPMRFVLSVALLASNLVAESQPKTLDIYFIDVEGGDAVLFVSPSGESMLIDSGWFGRTEALRDAGRILAATKEGGLRQINHLVTTHFHADHIGGMVELARQIPILDYIDHGSPIERQEALEEFLDKTYPELYGKAKHTVAKPGDEISVAGLDVQILTSAGQVIRKRLSGTGRPNPLCTTFKPPKEHGNLENAQSVGILVTFGKFRAIHLGDLTWEKEFELMCPNNPIGTVDLFAVSSHGKSLANTEVLVHAIRPRVAILNGGPTKGEAEAMKTILLSPGLQDLWQLHFSLLSGQEYSAPGMFIANVLDKPLSEVPVAPMPDPRRQPRAIPPPAHNGTAYWIKVSAQQNGDFSVTNGRNGIKKTYTTRASSGD